MFGVRDLGGGVGAVGDGLLQAVERDRPVTRPEKRRAAPVPRFKNGSIAPRPLRSSAWLRVYIPLVSGALHMPRPWVAATISAFRVSMRTL
jgi:hypothetical protein